jgi:hypothetical protein
MLVLDTLGPLIDVRVSFLGTSYNSNIYSLSHGSIMQKKMCLQAPLRQL